MSADADSREVADLYRRYAPAVHRRAVSLLSDGQEALDVTQETFLAYMKARSKLRGGAAPFTVLYQIATYQSVDRLRRRSRWSGRLAGLELDEADDGAREEPAEAHPGEASRVDAAQDLALLTRGEDPLVLTAAFLYFVEGHTTEEIGQVLDLSRKTVGKHLAHFADRARKRYARFTPLGLQ
ncbi:MAG: sigma-70 family RNA polymerase sigma factor [Myxococcales bacterium]|nr:sigma-70 family RNA polymerase sigma factor [Myxococcales bacterium]